MWKFLMLLSLCGLAVGQINSAKGWTHGLEIQSQTADTANKTFVVVSRLGAPFLMMKEGKDGRFLEANDRYEGYSMDLMKEIAKVLKFKFRFELVPDGRYGALDKSTGQWDGIIREILDRRADFGVCDLTMTADRASAVAFTPPFMSVGISILYTKPKSYPSPFFIFLSSLSLDVWLYMSMGYIAVTILIYVLSRTAPHPPSEYSSKDIACRIICVMWAFFALVMLVFYTSYLCTVLSMDKVDTQISNTDDLVHQSSIQYGCVQGGSTMNFFKNSETETNRRMYFAMMSAKPSVFTKSNEEGKNRVLQGKGKYAFLMESAAMDYITERNCDLEQVGRPLDDKGFGIAMPMNSPYQTAMSEAVLRLSEEGILQQIKDKWWKAGLCEKNPGSNPKPDTDYVVWFFVFLGGGCFVALILAVIEYLVRMLRSK